MSLFSTVRILKLKFSSNGFQKKKKNFVHNTTFFQLILQPFNSMMIPMIRMWQHLCVFPISFQQNFLISYPTYLFSKLISNEYIYIYISRRVRYDHVFYIVPLVLNIEVIDNRVSRLNCRKVEGYILRDLSVSHIACPAHSFRFTMGKTGEREGSTKRRNEAWLEGFTLSLSLSRRFARRPFRVFITKRIEKLIFIYLEASQVIVHQESCTGKTL